MPRPRFEKLPEEKKKSILAAAAGEFAERGYAGASLNRIIERAGISKGAMYYYFDDKEDLFLKVILDIHEEVFAAVGDFPEAAAADEFWTEARNYFRGMIAFAAENPLLAGLIRSFNGALSRGDLTRPVRSFQQPHFDFHNRFVRLGQSVGAVRSDLPDDLLFPLLEAVDEAGDLWFARHFEDFTPADWEGIHRTFFHLYRRILEPGPDALEVRS